MTYINVSRLAAPFLLATGLTLAGCSSAPVARGVMGGHLASCPSSDNCVSSFTSRKDQQIEPFHFTGSPEEAMSKLKTVLAKRGDTKVIKDEDNYLRVEFTTRIMRFVDDGEFLLDGNNIDVRSASRVGYSDFGKNRSRMEEIRKAFEPCCS